MKKATPTTLCQLSRRIYDSKDKMFKIFIYYLIFIPTDAGDAKPYGEHDGDREGDAVEKVDWEVINDLPQKRVEKVTDLQKGVEKVNDLEKVEGKILDPEKELSNKPLILVGLSIVVER
jgi:hypothetical protein